jgi:hypothetical protein
MNEREIRKKFSIPKQYSYGGNDQVAYFCWCDSTIEVELTTGKATESHMAYSLDEGIHYFAKREWPNKRVGD